MVRAQMDAQVRADGSHFEQSTYYHVYALDMLKFSALLEEMPPDYTGKLRRMEDYLDALLGPQRRLPFLGDDDGGRFFHPYGPRDCFGRASLAAGGGASIPSRAVTAGTLLPPPTDRAYSRMPASPSCRPETRN